MPQASAAQPKAEPKAQPKAQTRRPSSQEPRPKAEPKAEARERARSEPRSEPAKAPDEASIRRIWQKLDRSNAGCIQVKDIVQNASFVKQECPRLLEDYERIAKGGAVKYQDVRRLLLGLMDGPRKEKKAESAKVPEDVARRLFDQVKDAEEVITAKSLVAHKEAVLKTLPALIHDFEKIDLDKDSKITWDELRVFIGGVAEWLEHELENVVGLPELKDQVRAFYRSVMLDQTRRQQGHDVRGMAKTPHMIFRGSPGTGKTSLGRIMAKLLHRIGVTSTAELKEVQRPDLVGEHVGHTGPKTQKVIDDSKSGVLFIDEAYRLTSVESKTDFGREAVETLMGAMNEPPGKSPVMIFAGYTRDMENFMRANEGLYRRIGHLFDFSDYEPGDLAQILEIVTTSKGFKLDPSLLADTRSGLARLIEETTQTRTRAMMNGGLCERIFDAAKQNLDARDDPENPSVLLSAEDLRSACLAIPPPPDSLDDAPSAPPAAAAPSTAPVAGVAPPPAPAPAIAPTQQQMGAAPTAPSSVTGRNIWFHIGTASDLRKTGGCLGGGGACSVTVRLDKRAVHCTSSAKVGAGRAPTWDEVRILPYNSETLIEFVVLEGEQFLGSATLALGGLDFTAGRQELRANDQPAGKLDVQVGWQMIAGATGGDALISCFEREQLASGAGRS